MTLQQADPADASSVVGRFLVEFFGLSPAFADPIGYAAQGIVAFVVLYVVGKGVVLPLADRAMDRRGLDPHAKNPLQKVALIAVLFVALAVAFGAAGRGSLLTSLATVAAAATLASEVRRLPRPAAPKATASATNSTAMSATFWSGFLA